MKPCTIPGCPNPHKAKGLCAVHYADKRRRDEGRSVRVTYEHCTVPGCDRPHIAKGMCALHRQRQRTGTDLMRPYRARTKPESAVCSFDGCDRPHKAKGLCKAHWAQQKRGAELTPIGSVGPGIKPGGGKPARVCEYPDCGRPHNAHGYCRTHGRMLRNGEPLRPIREPKAPTVKAPKAAKATAKGAPKKPKSVLPAGWLKPAKIILEDERPARFGGLPDMPPLYASVIAESDKAAVRAFLARHDALDLADMLGVAA